MREEEDHAPDDAEDPPEFRTLADVEDSFAEAIVHRPGGHRVLGFKLRPFSFWHAAQLDFIGSPFAGHRAPFHFAALYTAVQVCRTRYPGTPAHTWLPRGMQRWVEIECIARFARRFSAELNKFSAYQRDYAASPEYITSESSATVKTPWYLFGVALLTEAEPSFSRKQAWDSPVGESRWWSTAKAEARGARVDLVTPSDRAQIKALGLPIDT